MLILVLSIINYVISSDGDGESESSDTQSHALSATRAKFRCVQSSSLFDSLFCQKNPAMESSMKRHQPEDVNDWQQKKSKKGKRVAEEPPVPLLPPPLFPRVVLNPADCDLDFDVNEEGISGSPLCEEGFAYCWSGARANTGILGGKYYFGCTIVAHQWVNMDDTPRDQQNLCRVGISLGNDPVGNLGETGCSFGFGDTGKIFNAGTFLDYGERVRSGDSIICFVDLENRPASISFSQNGKWLGIAKKFDAGGLGVANLQSGRQIWESAVFPHILLKNVLVRMQFSAEDGQFLQEGYKPWSSAFEDGMAILGPTFQDVSECEVIMMVGLPVSGKSYWAGNWVKNHPEKRYILLGTDLVLAQMKLPGLLRTNHCIERFERLMDSANKILNTLLSRASKMPRNFIIDQENVYKNVRRRKLRPFANYHKIAVVVFPKPEEHKKRAQKRFAEMGREVPAGDVNQMLVKYSLPMTKDMPNTDEYFDEVFFIELDRKDSQRCLDEMKKNQTLFQEVYQNSGKGLVQPNDCARIPSSGAPLQTYEASSHEIPWIPSSGASQQNYQGQFGVMDYVTSHSIQNPFEALPTSGFSNFPGYHVDNERNYASFAGYPQCGMNDSERRLAVPGDMNEQYAERRASGRFASTSDDNRNMNELIDNMSIDPCNSQNQHASQSQGPTPQLFPAIPARPGSSAAEPSGSPYGMPPHGHFPPS